MVGLAREPVAQISENPQISKRMSRQLSEKTKWAGDCTWRAYSLAVRSKSSSGTSKISKTSKKNRHSFLIGGNRLNDSPEGTRASHVIRERGQHCARIINNIQDISTNSEGDTFRNRSFSQLWRSRELDLDSLSSRMTYRPLPIPYIDLWLHWVWLWTDGRTDGHFFTNSMRLLCW